MVGVAMVSVAVVSAAMVKCFVGTSGGWALAAQRPTVHLAATTAWSDRSLGGHGTLVITPYSMAWGATVRGTYGTPEAGTRTAHVRQRPPGASCPEAGLCLWYVYRTREAGTRSPYVQPGGPGTYITLLYGSAQGAACVPRAALGAGQDEESRGRARLRPLGAGVAGA